MEITVIRKANKEDIKNLTDLFDNYRVFYDKESDKVNGEKFIYERLSKNDSVIFVAENETKNLMGFVQLYPLFSSTRMKPLWLLNDLFVDKKYRGKHVSIQMIEAAKKLCDETNACGLILETAKSNDIGNSLYPKAGFKLENESNYYFWNK